MRYTCMLHIDENVLRANYPPTQSRVRRSLGPLISARKKLLVIRSQEITRLGRDLYSVRRLHVWRDDAYPELRHE